MLRNAMDARSTVSSDAKAAGLPEPGGAGQGEQGHPGEQVEGDLDDLQTDLVLRGVVEGEIAQAGGAGGADAVLGPGARAEEHVTS